MIATVAFVLGFVIAGLGTLLVAMRAGSRGSGPKPESHRARVLGSTGIAVFCVVFGVGIPIAIGIGNSTAAENNGPGGLVLNDSQIRGRTLFAHNCSGCHTLDGAKAVGKVGPNLDQLRPPKVLVLNAIAQGRAQGRGQMPAQLLSGRDARDVANFVSTVAGR